MEEPAVVEEPEPTHVYQVYSNLAKPPAGTFTNYVHLPVSLGVDNKTYNEERLRQILEGSVDHMDATQRTRHEHPWRVIRTRNKRGPDGELMLESNARIVRWEDGSEHLFIGDSVVYQVTKQKIRRGVNDVYSLNRASGELTFWSPLDEKLVFKLIREPNLRPSREDKKQRKVKLVGAKDEKEEEAQEAIRVKAQGKLAQARAKKERSTVSRDFDSTFLEEGAGYVDQPEADDVGFIDDSRQKRSRSEVNESKILDAKRRSSRGARNIVEEEEDDEDEDDEPMEDVVDDDDDEDDDTGGGGDDGLQLYDD